MNDSGASAELDTSTPGTKSVTANAEVTWKCTATGATTTTNEHGTASFEVTDEYSVAITSPTDNDLYASGANVSLAAKARKGSPPYTLTWTVSIEGGDDITPSTNTMSQADDDSTPSPATISVTLPESAKGKKVNVKVEAVETVSSGEPRTTSATHSIYVPKITVKKMDITSEHGVMKDYTTNFNDGGQVFPSVEYTKDSNDVNVPISHSWDENSEVTLTIDVEPSTMPSKTITIKAEPGGGEGFNFEEDKQLSGGSDTVVTLTSEGKLEKKIAQKNLTFDWKFLDDEETELASSGAGTHFVYVTADTPYGSGTTRKRIEWAVQKAGMVNNVKDAANGVHTAAWNLEIVILPTDEDAFWRLSDPTKAAQCIDCVTHQNLALKMLGFEETWDVVLVYPRTAHKALSSESSGLEMVGQATHGSITKTARLGYITDPVTQSSGDNSITGSPPVALQGYLGVNSWEACLVLNYGGGGSNGSSTTPGDYFMGGVPQSGAKPNPLAVLEHCVSQVLWTAEDGTIYQLDSTW
jgi:hypothetical protein